MGQCNWARARKIQLNNATLTLVVLVLVPVPFLVPLVECYCFFLLIIIDEGAGDLTYRFVILKPALSDVMFKLLL